MPEDSSLTREGKPESRWLGGFPMEPGPNQVEAVSTAEPVEQQDGHTDDRGDPRGQHSAEDSHIQGEDEQIVQQDIGQAAHQHG